MSTTARSVEIGFAADHPTAAGHFPGNPIIPGAVLLDAVLLALAPAQAVPACAIRLVKFQQPVRPGDRLRIEWETKGAETQFTCLLAASGEIAATGLLRLADKPG